MDEERSDLPTWAPVASAPAERRESPRAPLERPVRIGPPGGMPYATVSARDFSTGGLFIDSEREVRVGARFAVEVPIGDTETAYVPVAEVVDNRSSVLGSGFGVRFIDVSADTKSLLRDAISTRVHMPLQSEPDEGEPTGFDGPLATSTLGSSVLLQEKRSFGAEPVVFPMKAPRTPNVAEVLGSGPDRLTNDAAATPTWFDCYRRGLLKVKVWVRSLSLLSGLLYTLAALAVMTVGLLVLLKGPLRAGEVLMAVRHTLLTPAAHDRLVGRTAPSKLQDAPTPIQTSGRSVNLLPTTKASGFRPSEGPSHSAVQNFLSPSSDRETERKRFASGVSSLGGVAAPEPSWRAKSRSQRSLGAGQASVTAKEVTESLTEQGQPSNERLGDHPKRKPWSSLTRQERAVVTANWEKAKRAVSDCQNDYADDYYDADYGDWVRDNRRDNPRRRYRNDGHRPRHRRPRQRCNCQTDPFCPCDDTWSPQHIRRLTIHLRDRYTRIYRRRTYRRPERFVVDVEKLRYRPYRVPRRCRGAVKGIRFGRHPGYDRFVIDTYDRIRKARAKVCGKRLEVALFFY